MATERRLEFEVLRHFDDGDSTLGLLFRIDRGREFLCYTLEDEHRELKVPGETCIPAGRYRMELRTQNSGMHVRYSKKFPEMHKGMIEVMNVPDFTDIYIHIGNKDDDTAGCLLVGDSQNMDPCFVGSSKNAYKHIYPEIANELARGKECWITYSDWC